LFILNNEQLPLQIKQAEANIVSARSEKINKENQYKRYLTLKDKGAVSLQQYDNALAAYEAAVAALEVAEAKLGDLHIQEERQRVIAPLDGQVLMMYRQPGAYVAGGTPLALVGDFRNLYFATPVDDTLASHLTVGLDVDLVFRSKDFKKVYDANYAAGNLGSSQRFTAYISEIIPPLSEPASMRNVVWQADNRSGLLEPHTYGGVSLQSRTGHEGLAIPLAAMTDNSHNRVYVTDGETIEERKVKTGTDDGSYIEIIDGLSEGEIVVTSGAEGLRDGMRATVKVQGGGER
jgi:RND family efflux transporter MFP subunit